MTLRGRSPPGPQPSGERRGRHAGPFTIRVWVTGHEWAKRQFEQAGIRFHPAAGYRYRLSVLQIEVSRTEVFDRRISRRTPGAFRTRAPLLARWPARWRTLDQALSKLVHHARLAA